MDQRIKEVVDLLAQYVDHLVQFAQGFGPTTLAVLLLVPILITALTRKVLLTLASALLALVSFMLIINPGAASSVLGVAGGIGSFLVALASILGRRRSAALRDLQKELGHLAERADRLEAAEQRRMLLELRAKGRDSMKG